MIHDVPTLLRPGIGSAPVVLMALAFLFAVPAESATAQSSNGAADGEVTFSRDVAPILQENCQTCHRPAGVAPMSLVTYDEVRPWAPIIEHVTGIRDRGGAMPPYYVERGIGIQEYQDDQRLTDEEVETIAAWVQAGAPEGNPSDLPAPREWADVGTWSLGEPDLIVRTEDFFIPEGAPDWWGDMRGVPTGLAEDRYVAAVEIREVNDAPTGERASVGGRWIVHHMIWATAGMNPETGQFQVTPWPVHELGRNADIFDPRAAPLLPAGSQVVSNSIHLNSGAADITAYLEIGFHLHPPDYEPEYQLQPFGTGLGDGMNIDVRANQDGQMLHAFEVLEEHTKITSFEPHLHAPGYRMCLEAIWGNVIETLTCSGYDHNWVRQYTYDEDHAPLLPKGTVLHIVAEMDNTENNPNIPDPRNWQGSGNRTVTNMFIDLGTRVILTDEQFVREMTTRRERLEVGPNDWVIGCPLCLADIPEFETGMDTADSDSDR